jgi:predicted  nucleic acid-binding Zn-ribbon protein
MNNKKGANKALTKAVTIICVALIISLVGTVITYTSILNAKDSIITHKNLQLAEQTSQTSDLEKTANETQSENDYLNDQISHMNSTISNLNQQILQTNSKISSLNSEIAQKDKKLNDQTSHIAALNKEISQCNNQISSLTSQISNLTNNLTNLNTQLSQKNATTKTLNDQISLLENETNKLTSEITNLNSQILTLNSQTIDLQTQNANLNSLITILNSELTNLQNTYNTYTAAYQNLRDTVNQRANHMNISDFITPQDSTVSSIVNNITGGWSDTSDFTEFWADIKALHDWVSINIDYRGDSLSPLLPVTPMNNLYYIDEMWQFPNETLSLGKGDCEDQAILLCSMIRCYDNLAFNTDCVWITSSSSAHMGVQVPASDNKLVILDPAGNYYSSNSLGSIAFNDIGAEINNWLNYWKPTIGSDVYVCRIFSDSRLTSFASTSEYITWMYANA